LDLISIVAKNQRGIANRRSKQTKISNSIFTNFDQSRIPGLYFACFSPSTTIYKKKLCSLNSMSLIEEKVIIKAHIED